MLRRRLLATSLALPALAALPARAAPGGVLRATLNANLNNLDPARAGIAEDYAYANLVFSGLTRIDEDLKVSGDLAERWESTPDLTQWTFHLRDGVKFHHGAAMTSADVVASFRRILDPATASPGRSQLLLVQSVDAVDRLAVRFTLAIPYAGFPDLLIERQLKVVPADRLDTLSTAPSGTGPFRLKSYQPGDRAVLERNPDYFEPGLPKLDGIVFRFMPEDAAKIAALRAGDVDLIWNLPLDSIDQMKREPGVTVDEVATGTWDGLVMSNVQKPFDDVRVRRAVLLALDKDRLMRFAVAGHGAAVHAPIPPASPAFNHDLSLKPDLAQAKALLAEAGYASGFEIPLIVPVGRPTRERMGLAVQQMLKPLGIIVTVQRLPYNRFSAEVTGKAVFYTDGYFNRPTIDTATYPWFHSRGSWNATMWHYKDAGVDETLDAARAAADPAQQNALYKKLQAQLVADPPGVVAYVLNFATAYNKKLRGFRTHPYAWMDLRHATIEG